MSDWILGLLTGFGFGWGFALFYASRSFRKRMDWFRSTTEDTASHSAQAALIGDVIRWIQLCPEERDLEEHLLENLHYFASARMEELAASAVKLKEGPP